jgi:hypothetical protein
MPAETTAKIPFERGIDLGPFYTETPPEVRFHEPYPGPVAEPWNAVTAFFFVVIVLYWAWRIQGRWRQYAFITICLPVLFVGGLGGTLYHGLRNWSGYFLMDVIPIYFLGLGFSIYLWVRLGPKIQYLFGLLGFLALMQTLGHWKLPTHWAINLSYAALALLILAPLTIVLIRTKFRHGGWIATGLVSFGLAWFCRIADTWQPPLLPMGTHWLWHTFGAATTAALCQYAFLIHGLNLRHSPATPR